MAKDKGIGELPGITPAAVVGLSRDGIVTMADLLAADFDRVAYIVDDYNEASRLVKEAAKEVPGSMPASTPRRPRGHGEGAGVSTPVIRSPIKSQNGGPKPAPSKAKDEVREPIMAGAVEMAMRGLHLGPTESGVQARETMRRRIGAVYLLLEHDAEEPELAAALLLESAEAGGITAEEIARRFGNAVEKLLEECASLRAVPMLPTGKLPRYYLDMAREASRGARRVCAAYLLASDRRGGAAWHARLLAEGLAAGEPDDLVTLARRTVEKPDRAAA